MTTHITGTREEWLTARLELLKEEKELTRRSDELAQQRQELPWGATRMVFGGAATTSMARTDGSMLLHSNSSKRTPAAGSGSACGPRDNAAARRAADWLCLAAAPTFATMALLTGVLEGGAPDICLTAQDASPLSGMVPMYLLMSAFHSAPWLKLVSSRRSGALRS
jgi:Bacterial protein of unknown function (DUF899)